MRKLLLGAFAALALISCQKDDAQSDIDLLADKLTSVTIEKSSSKSDDDTITVVLNGVSVTGTFNGNETYDTNAAGSEVNASRQYTLGTNKFNFQKITLNLEGNTAGPESGYITFTTGEDVVVIVANGTLKVNLTTSTAILAHEGSGTVTVDDLGVAPTSGIIDPFSFEAVFNLDAPPTGSTGKSSLASDDNTSLYLIINGETTELTPPTVKEVNSSGFKVEFEIPTAYGIPAERVEVVFVKDGSGNWIYGTLSLESGQVYGSVSTLQASRFLFTKLSGTFEEFDGQFTFQGEARVQPGFNSFNVPTDSEGDITLGIVVDID